MNKYIKTTLTFVGVWFMASLLNGLLSGIAIIAFRSGFMNAGVGELLLCVVLSFVFSAPVVGIVWFIVIMAQAADKQGDDLFQFALGTAFMGAVAAGLIFIFTLGTELKEARVGIALSIIISALAAVLFFRKQIKTNE
jgi:predicted membrane-bound spermidine synthase